MTGIRPIKLENLDDLLNMEPEKLAGLIGVINDGVSLIFHSDLLGYEVIRTTPLAHKEVSYLFNLEREAQDFLCQPL